MPGCLSWVTARTVYKLRGLDHQFASYQHSLVSVVEHDSVRVGRRVLRSYTQAYTVRKSPEDVVMWTIQNVQGCYLLPLPLPLPLPFLPFFLRLACFKRSNSSSRSSR